MGSACTKIDQFWWPTYFCYPWDSEATNWEKALQDIEDGKRDVNAIDPRWGSILLHHAAKSCCTQSRSYMQRLLELGANPSAKERDGSLPMHCCFSSSVDILPKFKLLPAKGLAEPGPYQTMPAFQRWFHWYTSPIFLPLLYWMLEQPECPVEKAVCNNWHTVEYVPPDVSKLVEAVAAERRRWSKTRAAWTATVVAAAAAVCQKKWQNGHINQWTR
jgi:hypothetical protein